jgi:hypothetical protein
MPFNSPASGSSRSSGTAIRASRATLRTVFLSTLTFEPSIGGKIPQLPALDALAFRIKRQPAKPR